MDTLIGVLVAVVIVTAIAYAVAYNRLVNDRNRVTTSWADVETELERRHTLVPQLVAVVAGAAAHERDLLVELSRRNDDAVNATPSASAANRWEPPLVDAVQRVVALRERYPALNSQQNFLELQRQLGSVEDRIAAARRFYNTRVEAYNRRTEAFPSGWVAARHGFDRADFFDV